MFVLKVCANSVESAINAEKGGANRIELCENLFVGGTTPSFGCIAETISRLNIPVNVLIRPRPGDFVYSDLEFSQMLRDIEVSKKIGVSGIVCGILLPNGEIDITRTTELVKAAQPLTFTFHRAFDLIPNPFIGLNQLIECGCSHLLTSGQKNKASEGLQLLSQLVKHANGRIRIIAGGGVNPSNIIDLAECGVNEFHLSGSELVARYNLNHTGVSFTSTILPENTVQLTNADSVTKTLAKLKSYFSK